MSMIDTIAFRDPPPPTIAKVAPLVRPMTSPSLSAPAIISFIEIQSALQQILSSSLFAKAQRTSRLLQFLISKRLDNEVGDISEYTIGLEVFDRDPKTYSTCDDPIVRVQMGRLRERLKTYYATLNLNADVILSIPIGNYMPHIQRRSAERTRFETSHLLAISSLKCFTLDHAGQSFTAGLNEELSYQLFREFGNKIVSHNYLPDNRIVDGKASAPHGVSHVLEGSVRIENNMLRASIRLVDAGAGSIAWSEQFDYYAAPDISLQEQLALSICRALKMYFSHG